MRKLIYKLFSFVVISGLFLFMMSCELATDAYPIVETPPPEVKLALSVAKLESKAVMLIFGADWCPPCRHLDALLEKEEVKKELKLLYETVKIDIGNWDKNMDIANLYGNPVRQGIPGIVLLSSDGRIKDIIEYDVMSDLLVESPEMFVLYFQKNDL